MLASQQGPGEGADKAPPEKIPKVLQVPDEHRFLFSMEAEGLQVYLSKDGKDGKPEWSFKAPLADLSDQGRKAGYHFAGPSWESLDGSRVVHDKTEEIAKVPATKPKEDIPWLRIKVKADGDMGNKLRPVRYVLRVNTRGGVAPAEVPIRVGTEAGVKYSATYLFYGRGDAPAETQRIVFLGDSITDGNTYPLWVRQALAEAGKPVPVCINAGIAGDTAAGMRKRLERDVTPHRPTLVTLSAGINDVLRNVKVEDYEADVSASAEFCKAKHVPLVILTTTVLGPKHAEADRRLEELNAALRRVANKYGCRVAEVNKLMREARGRGEGLLEDDNVHLNEAGYRVMTRALLDALGHKDVAVPRERKLELLPGLVRRWQMRTAGEKEVALNEKAVQTLQPDKDWATVTLPQQERVKQWWFDQERQRGFAVQLDQQVGPGKRFVGVAVLEEEKPRKVYVNTGGELQTVWLNGKRIYKNEAWTGWHAGKERIAAELVPGRNTLVIETGANFFLGVTDGNDW
jgi:lysophospholipase L1-like esterase